jgi:hypothetical protein
MAEYSGGASGRGFAGSGLLRKRSERVDEQGGLYSVVVE